MSKEYKELIVGLDIGTSKITCVVAELKPDGRMEVVGLSSQPSSGLKKGVVVNIEASHIYLDCQKFFGEVARVLRPGGHFLYADVREPRLIPGWEADLAAMPMRIESQKVINAEVLRGLTKNSPRTSELIHRNLPVFMRRFGREFAVVEGSWLFNDLQSDELTYRVYHLVRN